MYGNIMYDRRIVRGNTYAQNVLPAVSILDGALVWEPFSIFEFSCKDMHDNLEYKHTQYMLPFLLLYLLKFPSEYKLSWI